MDRDLLGIRRRHSPLPSSSRFKSARSASSRDILESVCIRYTLGKRQQIWEVRREVIMSGKPQPGLSATRQLYSHFLLSPHSACSHCRKHLPFWQILPSLSLYPFPPFISCLHQHKEFLHLIPGLLGTLLDSEIFTARLNGNLLPLKLLWLVMVNSLLSIPNIGIPFED